LEKVEVQVGLGLGRWSWIENSRWREQRGDWLDHHRFKGKVENCWIWINIELGKQIDCVVFFCRLLFELLHHHLYLAYYLVACYVCLTHQFIIDVSLSSNSQQFVRLIIIQKTPKQYTKILSIILY
jgi:hypothetical protein